MTKDLGEVENCSIRVEGSKVTKIVRIFLSFSDKFNYHFNSMGRMLNASRQKQFHLDHWYLEIQASLYFVVSDK